MTTPNDNKYLTFFLGDEEYGIAILRVHEIIGTPPITRIPRLRPYVRGVVNVRGRVISVVDLRLRFDLPAIEPGPRSCIVVVRAHDTQVGLLVDRVSEVLDIEPGAVTPAPSLGADTPADFLAGVANSGGRVRLLLDVDRVLDGRAGDAPAPAASDATA